MTNPSTAEILASVLFAAAVLHTFLIAKFEHIAGKFPQGSVGENLFHLLGEVEVVFGLWAGVLLVAFSILEGPGMAISYAEGLNFTEPMFVFVIMALAATRPVIALAERVIFSVARVLPMNRESGIYVSCLFIGPLLGSFITEPAAMTVTALILRDRYFRAELSSRFKYLTLATLFVNVSIGGVLTPFAAPPVLMVAGKWNWDIPFMLTTFGWKVAIAAIINASCAVWLVRRELLVFKAPSKTESRTRAPMWLTAIHILLLSLIVATAHHPVIFTLVFLFFMGIAVITREYQDELKLKESLLVAFFLAGLVILGGMQRWWLEPLIGGLNALPLFLGTTALTAITDNAALTYLGAQIPGVSDTFKYSLVAGAVAGGGLTVIANAPNPAGFAILQESFGPDGISPVRLLMAALVPTVIAMACVWLLP